MTIDERVTPVKQTGVTAVGAVDDALDGANAPRLVDGTQLLGPYQGSGCVEAPYLVRRPDGSIAEVSRLLHLVAAALDGKRQVTDIAATLSIELGRRLTAENVSYLIERKLCPLGIIADSAPVGAHLVAAKAHVDPILGLSIRFGVVSQSLVRAVATVLQPLFAPGVIVVIITAVAALDAWLVRARGIDRVVPELVADPVLMLVVAGTTLLAGAFHEFGHATATVYGGAEPGRIGAGIYLLWPVFYNDLNDSYRLSRRSRLRADLGGVYFNVVFILVLFGAYGVSGFKPLLVAILVQHLVILQQFLPFVRLDGYYIVSDIAGVPDLFGRIRPVLASLVPGRRRADVVTAMRPCARLVVTVWVLLTVPLLVGALVLFGIGLPRLASTVGESALIHVAELDAALDAGAHGKAILIGLQAALLAVPLVGLSVPLFRAVRRLSRSASQQWAGHHSPCNGIEQGASRRHRHTDAAEAQVSRRDRHRVPDPGEWDVLVSRNHRRQEWREMDAGVADLGGDAQPVPHPDPSKRVNAHLPACAADPGGIPDPLNPPVGRDEHSLARRHRGVDQLLTEVAQQLEAHRDVERMGEY